MSSVDHSNLFPPIEPHNTGTLKVDDVHSVYWEQSGNPEGIPVIFLHGGPGAGASPKHRRFFDPNAYNIIIFDQRGAGRSTPLGELRNNTPYHLVHDMEQLRKHLQIKQWLIFGGSWGSTLAIAYGQSYPEYCLGFILRGIFLMRDQEINWFMQDVRQVLPEAWKKLASFIPQSERKDLLTAYYKRLTSDNPNIYLPAAKAFSRYEAEISTLLPSEELVQSYLQDNVALGLARIETHYFLHNRSELGDALLKNISRINHLPATIVQGRYDMCCPFTTAFELAQAWPKAELTVVPDAGHSAFEPGIQSELIHATEKFKTLL